MTSQLCKCGQPRHNGTRCKECYNTYMRDYMAKSRQARPEVHKDAYLRKRYNISLDRYKELLSEQNGQCAICGTSSPGQTKYFEVDHNHACCDKKTSCGACVRGLLCTNCNTGISRFSDDPDKMDKAAAYVRARSLTLT